MRLTVLAFLVAKILSYRKAVLKKLIRIVH